MRLDRRGVLTVRGDRTAGTQITVGRSADGASIVTQVGSAAAESFDAAAVTRVVVRGGKGNDTVNVNLTGATLVKPVDIRTGAGDDTITAGGEDDVIDAGTGNDKVDCGDGTNRVKGGAGDDELTGGAGQDTLVGGRGLDRVTGSAGADTFDRQERAAEIVDLLGEDTHRGHK